MCKPENQLPLSEVTCQWKFVALLTKQELAATLAFLNEVDGERLELQRKLDLMTGSRAVRLALSIRRAFGMHRGIDGTGAH